MTDHIDVPIVATGDWIDAAWINQYIGDNVRAWRQAYTAAGMIAYALDANTLAGLAKPGDLGILQNDAAGVLAWATGGSAGFVLRRNALNTGLEFVDPRLPTTIVSRSANGSVNGVIPWNVELRDDEGWHDNAVNNSRITVPTGGVYIPGVIIGLFMPSGGATVNHEIEMRVNGSLVRFNRKSFYQEGTMVTLEFSAVPLVLAANDYVECATLASKTVGGGASGQHSFFSLTRIG